MEVDDIVKLITIFEWRNLQRLYGSAHSTIIGFISTEWMKQSKTKSVLDGAPSPKIGNGRKNQTNADLLLCQDEIPLIAVEVEASSEKCGEKISNLCSYFNESDGIKFCLLIMTNVRNSDESKFIVQKVRESKKPILLISIHKEKSQLKDDPLSILRKRNQYYSWETTRISFLIRSNAEERTGDLWKRID